MKESLNSFLVRLNEAVAPLKAMATTFTEMNLYRRQYYKIEVKLSVDSSARGYYSVEDDPDISAIAAFCAKAEGEGRSKTLFILDGSVLPERAFASCKFENIVVPEGMAKISDKAFLSSKNLKSITIPASVEEIGHDAFSKCESLESVTICNKKTSINSGAFFECPKITEVNLPAGLTWKRAKDYFKDSPWAMNEPKPVKAQKEKKEKESTAKTAKQKGLSKRALEEKAQSILSGHPNNVICDGKSLTIKTLLRNGNFVCGIYNIDKNSGAGPVDWNALAAALKQAEECKDRGTLFAVGNVVVECSDIADEKRVKHLVDPNGLVINGNNPEKFPEGITKIADEQAGLEFTIERTGYKVCLTAVNVADSFVRHDIVIPDGITEIGEDVFSRVPSIVSVYIPDSVLKIGRCAFYECYILKTVRLSNMLSHIENLAFCNCESLEEITFPQRVSTVGAMSFNDCFSLRKITILNPAICFEEKIIRSKYGIGIFYVFDKCKAIKEIYMPEGLAWSKIKKDFPHSELVYPLKLEDVDRKAPIAGKPLQEMALADAVKDLFYPLVPYVDCEDNNMIMFVRLPNGNAILGLDKVKDANTAAAEIDWDLVKELKKKAEDNPNSGTLNIFGGTLVKKYSELSFLWKNKKYDRTKKKYIDSSDFHTVEFAKGNYVFNDFFKRKELTQTTLEATFLSKIVFDPEATLEGEWLFNIPTLKELVLPNTLTEIPDYAFNGGGCLANFDIPGKVTDIGIYAFYGCVSLKSITLPDKITEIKNYTFERCRGLKEIVLPDGLTRIDRGAFCDCEMIEKLIIPDGVTEISEEAFSGCKVLKEVLFPESLTRIGNRAFAGCGSIASICLPKALERLDSNVFQDCKRLTSVTIENPDIKWQTEPFAGCDNISEVNLPLGFPIRSANRIFKGSSWKSE